MKIEPQNQPITHDLKPPTVASTQASRTGSAVSARGLPNAKPVLTSDQKLEKQVRTWVGQTFFGTILKQMRDDPFKSKLFDGGRGGEAFQEMADGRLAQHMANGVGTKLVRPIMKTLLRKKNAAAEYAKSGTLRSKATLPHNQEAAHVGADHRA